MLMRRNRSRLPRARWTLLELQAYAQWLVEVVGQEIVYTCLSNAATAQRLASYAGFGPNEEAELASLWPDLPLTPGEWEKIDSAGIAGSQYDRLKQADIDAGGTGGL